jgi:hypothetical protein
MTTTELLAAFGPPLRTEPSPDGGEDWFYNFGGQGRESRSESETVSTEHAHSYSVGRSTTTTTTMTRLPVHVSREGRVMGEIPAGQVIVE